MLLSKLKSLNKMLKHCSDPKRWASTGHANVHRLAKRKANKKRRR